MEPNRSFNIHGDNIVECERAFSLILECFRDQLVSVEGPSGSLVCPDFQLNLRGKVRSLHFTFLPGFGRWNENILDYLRNQGGILREAADVVLTRVAPDHEIPLLAIEYCGALPAGNQAWQRSGRAYSIGRASVPYLYVAELGGFELDNRRNRKAARLPNPAVPYSYLAFSHNQNTPVLPVFVISPGADENSKKMYGSVFAEEEFVALAKQLILEEDYEAIEKTIESKVLSFVKKRAASTAGNQTLRPGEWGTAYEAQTEGKNIVDYLSENKRLNWSKTAYIKGLTNTAATLMKVASQYAFGLTATNLPLCIVPSENRNKFAKEVNALYGSLPAEFLEWLGNDNNLVICWIMGFKPRGDDARPDRGLGPLARMLVGDSVDILTVVYGPAKPATWPKLNNDPGDLIQQNGLWEAILTVSDGLLVDSATDANISKKGYLRNHWRKALEVSNEGGQVLVKAEPTSYGEHDVDTVLHLLLDRLSPNNVFEGMCNPPGGDWSGVSLLTLEREHEYRWLSLPRVSGDQTKRPDHVFEIFDLAEKPIIFSIESKETARSVESAIGTRLNRYIENLIHSPASAEKRRGDKDWNISTKVFETNNYIFASAAAFIVSADKDLVDVARKAKVDLTIGFEFQSNGQECQINLVPSTDTGRKLADYLKELASRQKHYEITINIIENSSDTQQPKLF